jgi:hypothetical protein
LEVTVGEVDLIVNVFITAGEVASLDIVILVTKGEPELGNETDTG